MCDWRARVGWDWSRRSRARTGRDREIHFVLLLGWERPRWLDLRARSFEARVGRSGGDSTPPRVVPIAVAVRVRAVAGDWTSRDGATARWRARVVRHAPRRRWGPRTAALAGVVTRRRVVWASVAVGCCYASDEWSTDFNQGTGLTQSRSCVRSWPVWVVRGRGSHSPGPGPGPSSRDVMSRDSPSGYDRPSHGLARLRATRALGLGLLHPLAGRPSPSPAPAPAPVPAPGPSRHNDPDPDQDLALVHDLAPGPSDQAAGRERA